MQKDLTANRELTRMANKPETLKPETLKFTRQKLTKQS